MQINLDEQLIDRFRDKVNNHQIFKDLYTNIDGKNKWNIICSAMDWINVTVEGIPEIVFKDMDGSFGFGYNHSLSLTLMQYITSIDILHESIIQLHRVLKVDYPFANDQSVFKQTQLSDDTYFKHIRAVFSTHPINLNSIDGVVVNKGEKFYASWPARGVFPGDGDFMVLVYSNDPSKNEKLNPLSINISDLNEYAEMRYQLLSDLSLKVDEIMDKHIQKYRGKQIETNPDALGLAYILLNENNDRFGEKGGHSDTIHYIIRMLETKLDNVKDADLEIIDEYLNHVSSRLSDIRGDLQNMSLTLKWETTHKGYEFEKIYSFLFSFNPVGESFLVRLIDNGSLPSSLLDNADKLNELQLVLEAYLYRAYLRNGGRVDFEQFLNASLK